MPSPTINAFQAVQNAQNALQRGDKLSARHWAELAASLAPEREEPWLLLAAVAKPQASVGYLKQALKANPNSLRAKAGMDWARKRVDMTVQMATTARMKVTKPLEMVAQTVTTTPVRVARPAIPTQKPARLPEKSKKSSGSIFFVLLPVLLIAVLALSIWNASPVLAVFSSQINESGSGHAPSWAQVELIKATVTLTPTETFPPTATFSATPLASSTPTETLPPTLTETPTASQTPTASLTTEITPTALPTDTAVPAQTFPKEKSNQPSAGVASSNSGGKRILVDISEQRMYVYEGETLVYSFIASTGMNNATRVGNFAVQSKIPNAYGSTWNIWMPHWLGIYYAGSMENGIHALPILPNGATLWAGYLGTPISYGCVVLSSYDAGLLYDWAEIGTPVRIQW